MSTRPEGEVPAVDATGHTAGNIWMNVLLVLVGLCVVLQVLFFAMT